MAEVNVPEVKVLVVFYSRYGETENLALAAGVGAVQARANIRLRRLADLADAKTIASDARWQENLERMKQDYIAPRDVDASWADAMILAAPDDAPAEMEQYLAELKDVAGKIAAPLNAKLRELAANAGFTVLPAADTSSVEGARKFGRQAAEAARKLKA
jgi:hypothetical protein